MESGRGGKIPLVVTVAAGGLDLTIDIRQYLDFRYMAGHPHESGHKFRTPTGLRGVVCGVYAANMHTVGTPLSQVLVLPALSLPHRRSCTCIVSLQFIPTTKYIYHQLYFLSSNIIFFLSSSSPPNIQYPIFSVQP